MSRMDGVKGTISDWNRPVPGYVTASDISLTYERLCLARRSDRSETSQRLTSMMQAKIEKTDLLGGDD